jgi:hypothetical protein
MKTILFSILFFLSSVSYGQGNLQFNQVLTYSQLFNVSSCGSNVYSWNGPTYTVPANKVWKIEYFSAGGQASPVLNINTSHDISSINSSPVWLKAGDQIQFRRICTTGGAGWSGTYLISIIEFNIVP